MSFANHLRCDETTIQAFLFAERIVKSTFRKSEARCDTSGAFVLNNGQVRPRWREGSVKGALAHERIVFSQRRRLRATTSPGTSTAPWTATTAPRSAP